MIGLTFAAALFAGPNAFAAEKVTVGKLICTGEGTTSQLIKSSQNLSCIFQPNDKTKANDKYTGQIKNYGLEIGKTGKGQLTWLVLAASKDTYSKGILAGSYNGVNVDASAGVGAGAKLLVGSNKTFSLQPLSVEAHEGANIAIGVTSLTLKVVE